MRYALFKRPLETLSAAWKGFGLHPRKLFSSSKHVKSVYKRGNAEDDRKILELSQEGLTTPQIAQQLPDYTYQNVAWRLQYLRAGPTPTSTGGRWQLHEDAVLKEKREVGVQWGQIMPSLPGRTIKAAQSRYYNLKHNETVSPHGDKKRKPWSLEEKQRVIDMRIVDKMSIVAISKHLGRTYSTTAQTWHRYGHAVLPADVTRTVRKENQWTVEQDRVFTELRASGHTYEDIKPKLPGKSVKAMWKRAQRLEIASVKSSPTKTAAIRKALQPVFDGTVTLKEVVSKFASSPPTSVENIYYRMRRDCYKIKSPPAADT